MGVAVAAVVPPYEYVVYILLPVMPEFAVYKCCEYCGYGDGRSLGLQLFSGLLLVVVS